MAVNVHVPAANAWLTEYEPGAVVDSTSVTVVAPRVAVTVAPLSAVAAEVDVSRPSRVTVRLSLRSSFRVGVGVAVGDRGTTTAVNETSPCGLVSAAPFVEAKV